MKYIIALYEYRVRNFSQLQKKILTLFSVLPLRSYPMEKLAEFLSIDNKEKEDFENAILELISQGWLDADKNGIFTYPLIINVLHKKLKPSPKKLMNYLEYLNKKLNPENLTETFEFIGITENLLSTITEPDMILASLAEKLGVIYDLTGHPNATLSYLFAAEILDYFFDNRNPDHKLSEYISKLYFKSFEIERSLYYAQITAEIRRMTLPENSPELAEAFKHLAKIYDITKNYEKAIEFIDLALDIYTEIYDKNNPLRKQAEEYHTYLSNKYWATRTNFGKTNQN